MAQGRPLVAVFDLVTSVAGTQTVMAAVLPRLTSDFDIVVIDAYNNPEYLTLLHDAGLNTVSLGPAPEQRYIGGSGVLERGLRLAWRTPWLLATAARLRRWVRQHRPDVIWFNQRPPTRLYGRLLPRSWPPLIFHAHGLRSAAQLGRRTARLLSRRFRWAVAVSRATARFLLEAGTDPNIVRVVYNAVDADRIRKQASADGPPLPERPADGVVFVQVGVFTRDKKAQHLSVEALGRLPAESNAQLWLCGDVPPGADTGYRDYLHERVRALGLEGRVHFLGWRTDVARVLAHADVCLLPSVNHSESCPMAVVEAMTLGKPCVGSDFGGIPELIDHEHTGLVCRADPDALAAAMSRLLGSPELREQMGQAGIERAERVFSLPRQAAEFAELLNAAIAGRRS